MNKLLTLIIPSYRSKEMVLPLLYKYYKKYRIIIIENSKDASFKEIIKKKFRNVDIYLKENIGFGRAVNFASKKVRTKYFFVINPDTKIYKNTLVNLIKATKKLNKFGAIGPINNNQKNKFKKNSIIETNKVIGAAMLVETSIFKSIKGFDENYFLYYEDNDFFLKCNSMKLKIFLITNSFIKHNKKKIFKKTLNLHSTTFSNFKERDSTYVIGGWHGQWSKFYFYKKHFGFTYALVKCLPNNLLNLFQLFFYIFFNPLKAKYRYFKIEGFICALFGMSSFRRSMFDIKNIY